MGLVYPQPEDVELYEELRRIKQGAITVSHRMVSRFIRLVSCNWDRKASMNRPHVQADDNMPDMRSLARPIDVVMAWGGAGHSTWDESMDLEASMVGRIDRGKPFRCLAHLHRIHAL